MDYICVYFGPPPIYDEERVKYPKSRKSSRNRKKAKVKGKKYVELGEPKSGSFRCERVSHLQFYTCCYEGWKIDFSKFVFLSKVEDTLTLRYYSYFTKKKKKKTCITFQQMPNPREISQSNYLLQHRSL